MTTIKAALVVQSCPAGFVQKNIESTQSFIAEAAENAAKIVVFPEMNLTGYAISKDILSIAKPLSQEIMDSFTLLAHNLNITILTGLAEKAANGQIFA